MSIPVTLAVVSLALAAVPAGMWLMKL